MWSFSAAAARNCGRLVFSRLEPPRTSASLCGAAATGSASLLIASAVGRGGEARVATAVTNKAAHSLMSSRSYVACAQNNATQVVKAGRFRFNSTTSVNANANTAAAAAAAETTAKSAASATTGEAPKKGFVAWYESHLEASPVRTKMITGSILWGLGDVVAQLVPHFVFDDAASSKDGSDADTEIKAIASKPHDFVYDYARTGRAAFFGLAIHAPLSHVHYNFLEWMTVRAGLQGLTVPVFKTVMEQFVYWSWFSNSLYHGAMGAMQGWSLQQCYDRIADVLWDTQKAQWVFWIPVQLLNFNFVPVRHQLNVVLLTSVVWTALLSAWYPPAEEGEDGKETLEDLASTESSEGVAKKE